ncbi:MAG: PQQ-dependent sugar dehydrogenase, partial [Gaiellaceae bacterium]
MKAVMVAVLAAFALAATASARTGALHLVRVAQFDAPVYATSAPGEPGNLYVVEQAGVIRVLSYGRIRSTPFLDIRSQVTSGGEQGLLSVAFAPDYPTTHRFYVDYTDRSGDTRVVQYRSNGTAAILSSAKQLVFVKDFASNHNGGQLQFGPDGRLYWGNGDGGGGGDPQRNGQSLARPFAKIMRLNVNAPKPRWTLVAYGLRNPWRFSFDRSTGDLYIGDVGQNAWEEIDYLPHGTSTIANFGWNRLEGRPRTHNFDRALRAEVRDAMWMLSRQWQLGEFVGDDAGSPVLARACLDLRLIDRYQAAVGGVLPFDRNDLIEPRVERRPVPMPSVTNTCRW